MKGISNIYTKKIADYLLPILFIILLLVIIALMAKLLKKRG